MKATAHALLALFLSLAMLLSTGCATIMTNGTMRPVTVKTEPAGADVYFNDEYVGTTPLKHKVNRKQSHTLRIVHSSYPEYVREINPGFNGWVVGNVLLGGFIGLGIDFLSGAYQSPSPGNVTLKFEEAMAKLQEAEAANKPAKGNARYLQTPYNNPTPTQTPAPATRPASAYDAAPQS